MVRMFGILLVGLLLSATAATHSHAFTCKRTTHSYEGFTNKAAFESWFPKNRTFNDKKFSRVGGSSNSLVWISRLTSSAGNKVKIKWTLTPSGSLAGAFTGNARFRSQSPVRYKCDRTATQVAQEKNSGSPSQVAAVVGGALNSRTDAAIYMMACENESFVKNVEAKKYVLEAKRRGLSCGVNEASATQIASSSASNISSQENDTSILGLTQVGEKSALSCKQTDCIRHGLGSNGITTCVKDLKSNNVTNSASQVNFKNIQNFKELKIPATDYQKITGTTSVFVRTSRAFIEEKYELRLFQNGTAILEIYNPSLETSWDTIKKVLRYKCDKTSIHTVSKTSTQTRTPSSAELEAERKKRIRLEQQLAALKVKQEQQQQTISNDTQIPLITIASANTKGKQGVIRGRASDNVGVAEVTIDGTAVAIKSNGSFEYSTFVPATGLTVTVQATDSAGLSSTQTVSLQRNINLASASISFDRLNPIGKRTKQNSNALALIIGVSDYENTPAKAVFADADAMMFRDYASEKLGIPDSRIKTMVNDNADIRELLLSVKNWLSRSVTQNQSDVYIFFAGHGLASDDGSKMYLLPYDGAPELLDDTAILRDRLFSDVAAANPRSVTVFLDTCYSGTTRGTDMLIASRPIAIRALEQSIPDNFTVMTAAAGDQTAKPLEEAKHGMFSYFLMKGMEGEADANKNNEITAGELHSYVQTNVIQQSSGSQTPELQGDADRVLVRFQ